MNVQAEDVASAVEDQLAALNGFRSRDWRVRPGLYPGAWKIGLLPSLAEIDDMLAYGMLRYPFFRMYSVAESVPVSRYMSSRVAGGMEHDGYLDYEAAMDLFWAGFAFELGALELWHKPITLMTHALSRTLNAQVDAQIFVTPPGAQGIDVHRDPADGMAVQLAGRKRWSLYERPSDPHWRRGHAPDAGEPILEVTLEPGDVLYFPAGAAHLVRSVDTEPSSHITFGIRHVDGETIVEYLIDAALRGVTDVEPGMARRSQTAAVDRMIKALSASTETDPAELVEEVTRKLVARNELPRVGRLLGDTSPVGKDVVA